MNFLQLAFDESLLAVGISRPNPAVGAVVVKDGIVVGKGRTQRPGNAHAEVMALRDAGEDARGAAIFVTLEPCCHYGRTPPAPRRLPKPELRKSTLLMQIRIRSFVARAARFSKRPVSRSLRGLKLARRLWQRNRGTMFAVTKIVRSFRDRWILLRPEPNPVPRVGCFFTR